MFVEDLLLDNHATPYKIKVFRDKFLDKYYFNVYFARGKIFSGGYTKSLTVCRLKARNWLLGLDLE